MSIETDLRDTISSLLTGGCHNTVNTQAPAKLPYAVFHEIVGIPTNTVHGETLAMYHKYQVDLFARTPEQAKGIALGAVKIAIESGLTIGGVLVFSMSGEYDPITKTYQYITEYQLWEL